MNNEVVVADRGEGGRFVAGHTQAGPGRPRGKTESEKVRELLDPHRAEVIAQVIELAKGGDPQAQKLFLTYLAPPPRPEAERVIIPGLAEATTPKDKADCIVAAVAHGVISFEAGERAMRLLGLYLQAITATDHEERLRALEEGKARLDALKPAIESTAATVGDDYDGSDLV